VARARRQAQDLLAESVQKARAGAEEVVRDGARQAEEERKEILRKAADDALNVSRADAASIEAATDFIVRVVSGAENAGQQGNVPGQ
jgi:vacuolar-type H+-ATPase subunit H